MFGTEEVCRISEDGGQLNLEFLEPAALSPPLIEETRTRLYAIIDNGCAAGNSEILLNLRRIDFVSSAALNLLLNFREYCEGHDLRLGLKNLSPSVREVFRVTQLDRLLSIEPDD